MSIPLHSQTFSLENGRTLQLQTALPQDAADFLSYIEQVASETDYLTFGAAEFNGSEEELRQTYALAALSPHELFLMARVDGILAGNLSFRGLQRPRTCHAGEFGVTVLKEYWGLGIGRRLIENLIDWARFGGVVRKINLRVREDNLRGQQLYALLGFQEEGRLRRDFFLNGRFYDSLCMGLLIDP